MNNNAKIIPVSTALSGPVAPASGSTSTGNWRDSRSAQEAERAARYRLVIEEGPQAGTFIYKTLDRLTGEVVRQLPREQVIDLMQADEYSSGSVINTSA